jgi:hypothetical protein
MHLDDKLAAAPQDLRDEVLRKVGRNLLSNQQAEQLLKAILGMSKIEGTVADAPTRLAERNATLATTSLGGLQRQFRDEILSCGEERVGLAILQGSRMIELLTEIASIPHRKDGWTDLARAAGIAQRQEPNAFADRKARYGQQSLKALVEKSQLFLIRQEELPGGRRTLIRPVSEPQIGPASI